MSLKLEKDFFFQPCSGYPSCRLAVVISNLAEPKSYRTSDSPQNICERITIQHTIKAIESLTDVQWFYLSASSWLLLHTR